MFVIVRYDIAKGIEASVAPQMSRICRLNKNTISPFAQTQLLMLP